MPHARHRAQDDLDAIQKLRGTVATSSLSNGMQPGMRDNLAKCVRANTRAACTTAPACTRPLACRAALSRHHPLPQCTHTRADARTAARTHTPPRPLRTTPAACPRRYYRCLTAIETRFPISKDKMHAQVAFTWCDAFRPAKK